MSETERVDEILAGRNHRAGLRALFVVGLVLSIGVNVVLWWQVQQYADNATQTAVSFAQQVQDACADGGLPVDGHDLCPRADEIVEDPGAPLLGPPVPGPQGERGFTGAQGPQGRTGPPGEIGPRGPLGPRGEAGSNGTDSTVPGPPGTNGTNGINGSNGTDGRGIQSMQCASGGWIVTYTDGISSPDSGPCRGPQGEPGTDSTVPGPKGDTGDKGAPGVGIESITCPESGDWTITYTDDTVETVPGPCRVEPIIDPSPLE